MGEKNFIFAFFIVCAFVVLHQNNTCNVIGFIWCYSKKTNESSRSCALQPLSGGGGALRAEETEQVQNRPI